jgi:hypothetical protein
MPGIEDIVGDLLGYLSPLLENCRVVCTQCDTLTSTLETCYNSISSFSYIITILCALPSTLCGITEVCCALPSELCSAIGSLCTFPCACVYPCYSISKIPREMCAGGLSTGMAGGWGGPSTQVGNIISVCYLPSTCVEMCSDVVGMPYSICQLCSGCLNCVGGFFGLIGTLVPEIGVCGAISACGSCLDLFGFCGCLGCLSALVGIGSTALSIPPSILELICSTCEVPPGIYDLLRNIVGIPFKMGQQCLGMEWIPMTCGVFADTCQGCVDPLAACSGAITGCVQRPWIVPI